MVLLQTTVHKSVHGWLSAKALNTGVSVASLVRSLIMEMWSTAPDEPGQRRLLPKPVRVRARNKAAKAKARPSARQLALPGTDRKKAAKRKRRQTVTQRRGANHIEPEAAQ